MNFIIVLLNGIILNIFIIKILIYYRRLEKTEKGEEGKEREKNEDSKKKETLKRGTKLLIITVKILKIQILKNKEGKEYSIKDGLILITEGKKILKTYILSISVIIIGNIKNENKIRERGTKKEIKIILKTNIKGIKILILSNDWILTIISWEILNKSLYILVSIKSENESGLAASLKYFVLSALSTTQLIIGVCILYYKTGSTNKEEIETSIRKKKKEEKEKGSIEIGLILILTTLLFKISAAPFYQWAPDQYENIETKITKWKIIIPKITVLIFIYNKIKTYTKKLTKENIKIKLKLTGSLSLIIGSLALNNQWKIKRFFAYSGISHVGLMLLALYALDIQSYKFNILIYGITLVNIFTILIILSKFKGRELKKIKDLGGIFKYNQTLSIIFGLNLFSLAGVCQLKILQKTKKLVKIQKEVQRERLNVEQKKIKKGKEILKKQSNKVGKKKRSPQ